MKVLIIGSKGHEKAHCIDWQAPLPNIEEYDAVIINMQSLDQETFDKTSYKISTEIKREIRTLFDTDREVFCIINQFMIPSPPKSGFKAQARLPSTNYDWLPAIVGVNLGKPGTSMRVIDKRFQKYMETVGEWTYILDLYKEPPLKTAVEQTYAQLASLLGDITKLIRYQFLPIAENKSRKTIAGSLVYQGKKQNGGIHLLPPPTKCGIYKAIEILLDLIYGEPPIVTPFWRKDIEIPGTRDLIGKIEERFHSIRCSQKDIQGLQRKLEKLDSYRDLLCATGENLEEIVQRTLSEIGIHTKRAPEGFPADLIGDKIAVEVTGIKGSISVGSEKVNQIARFKESFQNDQKVLLVANTYRDLKPSDRKGKDFTQEVTDYLKAAGVCCITTKTLLQVWKDVKKHKLKADESRKSLLEHNGELTLNILRSKKY